MKPLDLNDVLNYVEENISVFHEKRIKGLNSLKLTNVLKHKNPYLFKAKNIITAGELVKALVDAHLSSNEETIFGDWIEGLAIFINKKVYGGWKSGITGIDLEFDNNNIRNIVTIKSGPNWGNSSQIKKMLADFSTAQKTLRTGNSNLQIVCVNGCCYGRDTNPDKGSYSKYCGQRFWEFIGGNKTIFTDIIEPLGYKAKEKNDEFCVKYTGVLNLFTKDFVLEYCNDNGDINWKRIVEFNSGEK
jgi:hypothetical protein